MLCRESIIVLFGLFCFFYNMHRHCLGTLGEKWDAEEWPRTCSDLSHCLLVMVKPQATNGNKLWNFMDQWMFVSLSSKRTELSIFTLLKTKRQWIICAFDFSCCWTASCVLDHFSLHSQWWNMNIALEVFSMNHSQRSDSTRLSQVWLPPAHTAEFMHPNAPPVFLPFHRANYRNYNFRL